MINPAEYKIPNDIVNDKILSTPVKIKLLKDWARDEYQKGIAEEENMLSAHNGKNLLSDILNALLKLGVEFDPSGAE